MIKLHLLQALQYEKTEYNDNQSFSETFDYFNNKIKKSKGGDEYCIHCQYSTLDNLEMKVIEVGYKAPPTLADQKAAANLTTFTKLENPAFEISPKKYLVNQFSIELTKENLFHNFICLLDKNEGNFFLRLVNENGSKVVFQALFPL